MSYANDVKKLLDIQDNKIVIEKDSIQMKKYKGNTAPLISGKLTYTTKYCENREVKNKNNTVTKNGTKKSTITLPMSGIYPTHFILKKQCFVCKACKTPFMAKTPLVDKHCFISNNTKMKVIVQSADAKPLKDIAKDYGELPEIIATGSNMFTEPEDIINHFLNPHFIWEFKEDGFVDIIYEWQGEEEVDGVTVDRTYVSVNYEDSGYDEYDYWFNGEGDVIQGYNYESDLRLTPRIQI